MKFKYKAQKKDGEIYEGEREAVDKFALYKDLRKQDEVAIFVTEAGVEKSWNIMSRIKFFGRISMHDKITFAKNLGTMLEAGLSLSRALAVLERQSKKQKLKTLLFDLNEGIKKGKTFHECLSGFPTVFSTLFVSMVKAGEESGSLSDSLKGISFQMNSIFELRRKIRGALVYPAIVISVMIVIGILLLTFVVPTLTATFKELGSELPSTTKAVIFVSDLLREHTLLSIAVLFIFGTGFYYLLKTKAGRRVADYIFLRIPVIGTLVKETNSARTTRTLSSLLSAGVPITNAISITSEVIQNSFYKEVLLQAEDVIQKGKPISSIFMEHEDLYPAFVGEMVAVGEETGKISEMFSNIGLFYENEVSQKTKDLSTIIEPFLMVLIGATVGFFAVAMITPMYTVLNTI